MLTKLLFFFIRTIILLIFLGWLASEFLIGDMSLAPSRPEIAGSDLNSASGLIVPSSDPRFAGEN
ncbi:hypothetical protein [Sinorhizobium meliloti]|uniref:hypothetical protein n=1 Tax=Rhizobium meliloti TaxID=382 RepID=UPI000FD9313E|nr:hypothetical protein [Sinorhizobium meliloti]RVH04380.1 hypothetical protein CN210_17415 [Sinorhizobium meliloti]